MLRLPLIARSALWTAALLACALASPARGQAERRCVVLAPIDGELWRRVRGQTADLDWTLVVQERGGQAGLERARRAGRRMGASAALWVEATGDGGWLVHIADLQAGRWFRRDVRPPAEDEALADSATDEAAALIVRSSLRAIAEGQAIGEEIAPAPREPSEAEEPPEAVPEPSVEAPAQPAKRQPAATRWDAALGWDALMDGQTSTGRHGVLLRVGAGRGRWRVTLRAVIGLPYTLSDAELDVHVKRASAVAGFAWRLWSASGWSLGARAGAGAELFARSTHTRSETLVPTRAERSVVVLLSAGLEATWWPWRALGFGLGVGVDVLPAAPVFSVESEAGRQARFRLWRAQPRLTAAAIFSL